MHRHWDLSAESVLLTGVAGFIGSSVADALLSSGARVIGVDNFDSSYDPSEKRANLAFSLAHPNFTLVETDCSCQSVLMQALAGRDCSAVIHLAARTGVRASLDDPVGYVHANAVVTQSVLDTARRLGISRIVLGSSSSIYGMSGKGALAEDDFTGAPCSTYAASKYAAELLCAAHCHLYAATAVALRYFTVYGPRQRPDLAFRKFLASMFRGEPLQLYGDGQTERDYTWIGDVVSGTLAALVYTRSSPGSLESVNIGSNRPAGLTEIVHLLAAAAGLRPVLHYCSEQPGDVRRTCAELTKAGRLLGYAPRMSLENGIAAFVEWYVQRGKS